MGRPLAALIAQPASRRPRDLEGRTVGVSGLPSDPGVREGDRRDDGGDASRVKQVTIGFAAVSRLLTKRVDAVPAFWNAEGVALKRAGLDVKEFRVEDYGAPAYPEVVLMTSRATLAKHRDRIERALAAIDDGLAYTRAHPGDAVSKIAKRRGDRRTRGSCARSSTPYCPTFAPGLKLDRGVLEQWADFDARVGLVESKPDVAKAFDFTLR